VRTAALVAADPRAEIHVFTDGAFTLPQSEDTTDPRVRWIGVGRQGNNVAITSLSIRRATTARSTIGLRVVRTTRTRPRPSRSAWSSTASRGRRK
jgi:hypothetical protein